MKRSLLVLLIGAATLSASTAQELNKLYEQRGFCSAQRDVSARAKCFEQLAGNAITALEAKSAPAPTSQASPPPKGEHADFVKLAKMNVTADFKDPATVLYRGLFVGKDGESLVLCGELNGRNSYGGYVGFKRFYSGAEARSNRIESASDRQVDSMFMVTCNKKIADVE